MLLCAAMAWAACVLTQSLPYWPINPRNLDRSRGGTSSSTWFARLWAVLPGAILWGASFPLALASVATPGRIPARLVGGVYAANTVGAIVGSLVASLLLILGIGTRTPQAGGHYCHRRHRRSHPLAPVVAGGGTGKPNGPVPGWNRVLLVLATGGAAGCLRAAFHPVPGLLVAYGRYAATRVGQATIIYVGEGLNASVAVSELSNGVRNYHNAGKVQASSEPQDMRLQRMLGHLTTLLPSIRGRSS